MIILKKAVRTGYSLEYFERSRAIESSQRRPAFHAMAKLMPRGFFSQSRRSATMRKNTCGTMWPIFLSRSCSAFCVSSSARRSDVKGSVRPSPFFVVPASSQTSPAAKATLRHSSGSTSESILHPVIAANLMRGAESPRAGAPACPAAAPPRRIRSSRCARRASECTAGAGASRPAAPA